MNGVKNGCGRDVVVGGQVRVQSLEGHPGGFERVCHYLFVVLACTYRLWLNRLALCRVCEAATALSAAPARPMPSPPTSHLPAASPAPTVPTHTGVIAPSPSTVLPSGGIPRTGGRAGPLGSGMAPSPTEGATVSGSSLGARSTLPARTDLASAPPAQLPRVPSGTAAGGVAIPREAPLLPAEPAYSGVGGQPGNDDSDQDSGGKAGRGGDDASENSLLLDVEPEAGRSGQSSPPSPLPSTLLLPLPAFFWVDVSRRQYRTEGA